MNLKRFGAAAFAFLSIMCLFAVSAYARMVAGEPAPDPWQVFLSRVWPNGIYQAFLVVTFLVTTRKLLFRLGDRER